MAQNRFVLEKSAVPTKYDDQEVRNSLSRETAHWIRPQTLRGSVIRRGRGKFQITGKGEILHHFLITSVSIF